MIERLAIIGTGNWGRHLVRNFCELLGPSRIICCDTDQQALKRVEQAYSGVKVCCDPDLLWEERSINAFVIATPAVTHYELTRKALEAGRDVFVEKPLALRASEAEELIALADEKGRVLMVDHLLLYHPAVEELINRVRSGELGRIYYLYGQRVNLGVVRTEENALWSLGVHDIAVTLELMGSDPISVAAQGGIYLQKERRIEDVVFLTMVFPAGELAHLHLSWLDPHKIRKLTVVGDEKMIVFDDMEPEEKLKIYDKGVTFQPENLSVGPQVRYGEILIPNVPLVEPLRRACGHFLDCVAQGTAPKSDGRAALRVLKVLEAAQRSLELKGKPQALRA
jgi:predicted dehydrogenase